LSPRTSTGRARALSSSTPIGGGERVWTAYWERSSGFTDDETEAGSSRRSLVDDAADAVTWGRARTPRVVVVDADGELCWAGVTRRRPRWPAVDRRWHMSEPSPPST
jgi:cytidine deaminase